ncbi:GtrA family protein [Roseivivax jejudonensis]|uniref:GtrA family protein n=1 Tax=Roseivivax jejudonensis TaxID=1529041 RepID=UPI000A269A13|nr:GtrA family protein [Roseivivax jejudonensis]
MHSNFLVFAIVSGCGWLLDVGLTMGLVQLGASPFWSSMIGAAVAVSFVYVVSLNRIFSVEGALGARGFPAYLIWQAVAIFIASALVAWLSHALLPMAAALPVQAADPLALASGAAKALVTPITLLANFLFMRWLTRRLSSGLSISTGQG